MVHIAKKAFKKIGIGLRSWLAMLDRCLCDLKNLCVSYVPIVPMWLKVRSPALAVFSWWT